MEYVLFTNRVIYQMSRELTTKISRAKHWNGIN